MFSKIKSLFRLTANSYINLPRFDGDFSNVSDYKKVLEYILKDIAMKHKTCIYITSANEVTRCEFIFFILHSIAFCYDDKVKVYSEYELFENYDKEPVN